MADKLIYDVASMRVYEAIERDDGAKISIERIREVKPPRGINIGCSGQYPRPFRLRRKRAAHA